MKKLRVGDLLKKTCDIFEQMADVLLHIQQAGCIFPDAKAPNWLMDDQGKIRLSDTKSFLFTDKDGNYSESLPGNKHHSNELIVSPAFTPPEFLSGEVNADHAHAFILGTNLYAYLTLQAANAGNYDFSSAVFEPSQQEEPSQGERFKALIEALVKPNPAERMSVQDAMNELFMMKNPECRTLFNKLNQLKIGPNDEKMQTYISEKQQDYRKAADPAVKAALLGELQVLVENLQTDRALREVVTIVKDLREKTGLFTIGMKDKADRIESAMANVPIDQRQNFILSGGATEVLKALASQRSLGRGGDVYLNKHGHIDDKKAETAFIDFKAKFKDQMAELEARNNAHPGPGIGSDSKAGPRR